MRLPLKSLTFWIFVGMFAGMLCGRIFGESIIPIAEPLSEIFLKLLRMAIMPLIIASITSGVISVGGHKNLGLLGTKTFGYYISTSLMAILTGQILVNIFKPGVGAPISLGEAPTEIPAMQQSLGDIIINIIPENPFHSMANGEVIQVVFFSILLGYFITFLKEPLNTRLGELFNGLFDAMLRMTLVIIWLAPLGVFGIIAKIDRPCWDAKNPAVGNTAKVGMGGNIVSSNADRKIPSYR